MTKSARHGAESGNAVQTGKETTRGAQMCKARLMDPKAVMPGAGKTIIMDAAIQRNATRLTT